MLQRIQSLYFLFVPVIIAVMFFLPLASFETSVQTMKLFLYGMQSPEVTAENLLPSMWYIMPVLAIILSLYAIATLLQYKNRIRQLKWNRFALMINILFIASVFYVVDRISTDEAVIRHAYNLGAYLSMVPALFIYLANGKIRKDEQKVRAADRLR